MKAFPLVQTDDKDVNQLQQNVSQTLNPILRNPINFGNIVESQSLAVGANTINHGLGRPLQGWLIVRKKASANIYDDQDNNANADKTLVLISDAAVVVNIYCF